MKREDGTDSGHPPTHPLPMQRRQSAALHFHRWMGTLRRARLSTGERTLFTVLLLGCLTLVPLLAQQTSTPETNGVGGLAPALTNWVVSPPVTPITNVPPPVVTTNVPARVTAGTNAAPVLTGATMRGVFLDVGQGKFGVAGRVLKLPAAVAAPAPATTSSWHRAIDFGMNLNKGNTDTLRYSLGLNAFRERAEDLMSFRAQGVYGESDGVKDTQNASARARYERQISQHTYGLAYADWATDPIADIDYRGTVIVSPGWNLIRSDRTIVNLEVGAGYLDQRKGDVQNGFAAARLAASADRILNDHVLAWCAAEYIPKLADTSVFYINSEAGVASLLARNLSLNVTLSDRFDNAPAPDTKNNDMCLTVSLNLHF